MSTQLLVQYGSMLLYISVVEIQEEEEEINSGASVMDLRRERKLFPEEFLVLQGSTKIMLIIFWTKIMHPRYQMKCSS